MAQMTVGELIKALQECPNMDALVTVDDSVGTKMDSVDASGSPAATFVPDAPEAGGDSDPGTVDLVGAA